MENELREDVKNHRARMKELYPQYARTIDAGGMDPNPGPPVDPFATTEQDEKELRARYPSMYDADGKPDPQARGLVGRDKIVDVRTGETVPGGDNYGSVGERLASAGVRRYTHCDLTGADVGGKELTEMTFDESVLDNLKAPGAVFRNSSFRNCSLSGADIDRADFSMADLRGADLSGATGENVRLTGALIDEETRLPSREYMKTHGWKIR